MDNKSWLKIALGCYLLNFLQVFLYFFAEIRLFQKIGRLTLGSYPEGFALFMTFLVLSVIAIQTFGVWKLKKWALTLGIVLGIFASVSLIVSFFSSPFDLEDLFTTIAMFILIRNRKMFTK